MAALAAEPAEVEPVAVEAVAPEIVSEATVSGETVSDFSGEAEAEENGFEGLGLSPEVVARRRREGAIASRRLSRRRRFRPF